MRYEHDTVPVHATPARDGPSPGSAFSSPASVCTWRRCAW